MAIGAEAEGLALVTEASAEKCVTAETAAATRYIQVRNGFLRLLQVNCRSIVNKTIEFWNLVDSCDADIVIGTESWLSDDVANSEILRSGYKLYRRDRKTRGGGVFLCVKSALYVRNSWFSNNLEILGMEIDVLGNPVEIIACYRPPNDGYEILDEISDRLENRNGRSILLAGDLNLPDANWKGEVCDRKLQTRVNRLVWEQGLTQVVDKPTRQGAILDIFLVYPAEMFLSCEVFQGISDHKAVMVEVQVNVIKRPKAKGTIVRQYRKANLEGLRSFLREKYNNFLRTEGGIEEQWGAFKTIVETALDKYVPCKILKSNSDPEYFNGAIRRLKRKVRLAFNRRHRSIADMIKFKKYYKELEKEKKIAHELFLRNMLETGRNNWSSFYKYVRRRRGNKEEIQEIRVADNEPLHGDQAKANAFNAYFVSVFKPERAQEQVHYFPVENQFKLHAWELRNRIKSLENGKSRGPDGISTDFIKLGGEAILPYLLRLFNISINNASLPDDWKAAIVVPIFKNGDKTKVCNYRPVSLTSVVCKIMEHLIAGYIRREWEKANWIFHGQHGFRSEHSCESQIVSLFQDLADVVDAGGRVDAVVIDFAKAFDVVPHNLLIRKVLTSGVDARVVRWISEFLRDRKQKVRIGNQFSTTGNVTSGVPQGSVLGPLLFLAYVNDLHVNIQSKVRLFADDCVIYRNIKDSADEQILQQDLEHLRDWAEKNDMGINGSKSKTITFGRGRNYEEPDYRLGEVIIPRVSSCKYLGIHLDSKLGWEMHINQTVRKTWKSLHFVMRILKKSSANAKELAYLTLVRPLMEYGVACWDPYRKAHRKNLDRIQRKANKFTYRSNATKKSWEPLETRRTKARLCALYKSYVGQPAWKEIQIRLEKPNYFGRSDHTHKIRARKQNSDLGKFSFCNRTIRDWNSLPAAVFKAFPLSVRSFRNKLEKYIK